MAEWTRLMVILDARLAASGVYVGGRAATVADIVLGLSVQRWMAAPIERARLAVVDACYALLSERDGFRQHGRNGLP